MQQDFISQAEELADLEDEMEEEMEEAIKEAEKRSKPKTKKPKKKIVPISTNTRESLSLRKGYSNGLKLTTLWLGPLTRKTHSQ